jgi:hypothetical protein
VCPLVEFTFLLFIVLRLKDDDDEHVTACGDQPPAESVPVSTITPLDPSESFQTVRMYDQPECVVRKANSTASHPAKRLKHGETSATESDQLSTQHNTRHNKVEIDISDLTNMDGDVPCDWIDAAIANIDESHIDSVNSTGTNDTTPSRFFSRKYSSEHLQDALKTVSARVVVERFILNGSLPS